MPRFGFQYGLDGQECAPQPFFHAMEIPNCEDPVFRAYCQACGITPGTIVNRDDPRVQKLQRCMDDATFNPFAIADEDYLTPRGF